MPAQGTQPLSEARVRTIEDPSRGPLRPCAFDEDYVRGLVEGNSSIEIHFVTYFSELLSIKLRSRVRSREMIEDVRQETFARVFKVLRQQGGIHHPERLGSFVNSVCNNILFERFREEQRYAPMNPEADTLVDNGAGPDEPLINGDRKRLVEKVLAKLRRRDRELLRMIFLEEVEKAEACRRLGVNDSYLRVMLHRATSRFRKELMEQPPAVRRFMLWNQRDSVKQKHCEVHYSLEYSDGT